MVSIFRGFYDLPVNGASEPHSCMPRLLPSTCSGWTPGYLLVNNCSQLSLGLDLHGFCQANHQHMVDIDS